VTLTLLSWRDCCDEKTLWCVDASLKECCPRLCFYIGLFWLSPTSLVFEHGYSVDLSVTVAKRGISSVVGALKEFDILDHVTQTVNHASGNVSVTMGSRICLTASCHRGPGIPRGETTSTRESVTVTASYSSSRTLYISCQIFDDKEEPRKNADVTFKKVMSR